MSRKREKKDANNKIQFLSYDTAYTFTAVLMASMMAAVFFGMALPVEGLYGSDTPAHINYGVNLEGYGLETIYIFLIGKIAAFPMLQLIVAVTETALVMATWTLSQKFISGFFDIDRNLVLAISTGVIFLTSIYIPYFLPDFYKEGLGTQPWHNSTYYGMRLVAVVYLMLLFRVLPRYLNGINRSEWGGMSLALAISTMFKPNFLITCCAVLGLIFIVDLIRHRSLEAFKNIVIMGTTVFPSLLVLLIQYSLIYVTGVGAESSGIEIVWFSDLLWNGTAGHMFLKLFRPVAFLAVVIVIYVKTNKQINQSETDINMLFAILLFICSIVVFSLFKETGTRAAHGNFGWSIPMAYYAMYLYIVPWFFQKLKEDRNKLQKKDYLCFGIGIALLFAHIVSGIYYFGVVASGVSYFL